MNDQPDEDTFSQITSIDLAWTQQYATYMEQPRLPSTVPLHNTNTFFTVACLCDKTFRGKGTMSPWNSWLESKGYGRGNFSSALRIGEDIVKLPRVPPGQRGSSETTFYRSLITELRISQHASVAACDYIMRVKGIKWVPSTRVSDGSMEESIYVWPTPTYEVATGTLSELLNSRPLFPTKINLSLDIGLGLDCLHDSGIVHSDIKAENILIFSHPRRGHIAKVADFGCSIIWEEDTLAPRRLDGFTNLWAAPECHTEMSYEEQCRADVYSFGLMVWQVITDGKTPFEWLHMMEHGDQGVAGLKEGNCILPLTLEALEDTPLNEPERMICAEILGGTLDLLNERRADYLSPLFAAHWVDGLWGKRDFRLSTLGEKRFVGPIPPINIMDLPVAMSIDHRVSIQVFESIKEMLSSARKSGDETLLPFLLYQLFLCHFRGYGTELDSKATMSALTEAAKYGSLEAQNIVAQFFDAHGAKIPSELAVCDWLEAQVYADTPGAATALKGLDPDRWEKSIVSMPRGISEITETELYFLSDLLGGPDVVDISPSVPILKCGYLGLGVELYSANDEGGDGAERLAGYAFLRKVFVKEVLKCMRQLNTKNPERISAHLRGLSGGLMNSLLTRESVEEIGFQFATTILFAQSSASTVVMPRSNMMDLLRAVRNCDIETVHVLIQVHESHNGRYCAMSLAASLHCSEILDILVQSFCKTEGSLTPWELGCLIYIAIRSNPLRSIRSHGSRYVSQVISTFEILQKYVELWYSDSHPVIEGAKSEGFAAALQTGGLYSTKHVLNPFFTKHILHPSFMSSTSFCPYLDSLIIRAEIGIFTLLLETIIAERGPLDELDGGPQAMDRLIIHACRSSNPRFIQRLMDPKTWRMRSLDRLMMAFDRGVPPDMSPPFRYAFIHNYYETATFLAEFTGQIGSGLRSWNDLLINVIATEESSGYTKLDYLLKVQNQFPPLPDDDQQTVVHRLAHFLCPISGQRRATLKVYWANILDRFSHLIEVPSSIGITPLILAVRGHNTLMVEALIHAGVDLNVPNSDGFTTIDEIIMVRSSKIFCKGPGEESEELGPSPYNDFISNRTGRNDIDSTRIREELIFQPYHGDQLDDELDRIYDMVRKHKGISLLYEKEIEMIGSLSNWTAIYLALRKDTREGWDEAFDILGRLGCTRGGFKMSVLHGLIRGETQSV